MARFEREERDAEDRDVARATFLALKEALEGNKDVTPIEGDLAPCMNGTCDNPDCSMCDALHTAYELVERAKEQSEPKEDA